MTQARELPPKHPAAHHAPPVRVSWLFDIKRDARGHEYIEVEGDGMLLLRLVLTNKGTAFSYDERVELGLDGILPPQVTTLSEQVERVYAAYAEQPTPIAKYQYLRQLQERQEILFYALLERHLEEMLPIVYTPTVGQAVQEFHWLYQSPRGISLSPINIDRAERVLENYPLDDVRMIVATDSSAILGIGDQGYGGLAIPIGKLALYTVAGGVSPFHTMPTALDVGTERMDLVSDPDYLGVRQRRLQGEDYLAFVDKFVAAVKKHYPRAVIQWEDLAKDTAFTVLERYRDELPSFNDDIQGTGAVALAGVLGACKLKGEKLVDQVFVIHGAGAGGVGVAWAILEGLKREGLSEREAAARIFVLDSKGLLLENRPMELYKQRYAQELARIDGWQCAGLVPSLVETIRQAKATVLLGLSGQRGAFTREAAQAMLDNAARPVIFPLSNPTSSSEATPADLAEWTNGAAIIATGSPFDPVERGGKQIPIGQGNNAFIFPGLGLGAILCEARVVTDNMVLAASRALADLVASEHAARGLVYPPVSEIGEVSIHVAAAVIAAALDEGVARRTDLAKNDLQSYVRSRFWRPHYLPFVRSKTAGFGKGLSVRRGT